MTVLISPKTTRRLKHFRKRMYVKLEYLVGGKYSNLFYREKLVWVRVRVIDLSETTESRTNKSMG